MALLYEKKDRIVTITLNRPEALNAFDPETTTEFGDAIVKFRDDKDSWVAIITGAGDRAFSAGADLKKLIPVMTDRSFEFPPTLMRGLDVYKPLIAAVNGLALGGGFEVVLACDIRIASEKASFGFPEVRWSLFPGWGGTQRLAREIPKALASAILYSGQPIDAQEAYRLGLVNQVVPPDKLMPTALEWASKICENGPLGVWTCKESVLRGTSIPLDAGLRLEQLLMEWVLGTEDAKEGPRAFAEKRKPEFKVK